MQTYELNLNYLLQREIKRDCVWRKALFCVERRSLFLFNFYTAILQSLCSETGISVCRDCNLSIVRLESHFAKIIWYWDVVDILYGVSDWRRACNCAESPVVFLHVGIEVGEVGDA